MAEKENTQGKDVVGSVLVVGGGIAGIQASLDLADSGYYVHMTETKSAIGGVMAQLDKTFPTNDCSMCVISPKLVECGRHLNIDLMTLTEIEEVTGEVGNFTVKLRQNARYIEMDKCTACGECAKACPIETPNLFDEGLRDRKAAFKLYPQGMPSAYAIEKRGTAPCKATCPAHVSIQGYIALINDGRYKEALKLFKQDHPFPGSAAVSATIHVKASVRATMWISRWRSVSFTAFWPIMKSRVGKPTFRKSPRRSETRKWPSSAPVPPALRRPTTCSSRDTR
jgi:ferredoxin